jgi:hypothetical protein
MPQEDLRFLQKNNPTAAQNMVELLRCVSILSTEEQNNLGDLLMAAMSAIANPRAEIFIPSTNDSLALMEKNHSNISQAIREILSVIKQVDIQTQTHLLQLLVELQEATYGPPAKRLLHAQHAQILAREGIKI